MNRVATSLTVGCLTLAFVALAQPEPEPGASNCAYDRWFMHQEQIDGCAVYMRCPHRIICWQDESGTWKVPTHGTTMQIVRCDVYFGGTPGPNGLCIGGVLAPPSAQVFFTPPIPAQFCLHESCEGIFGGGGEE